MTTADPARTTPPATSRERGAEGRRRWWAAHPDYAASYRAENRQRLNEVERDRQRRKADELRRDAIKREKARERARIWAAENPERMRERRARYRQAHPDRIRQSHRTYQQNHRDEIRDRVLESRYRNPETHRAAQRRWREANRERLADQQRLRRRDPGTAEQERASSRDARRLRRRLARLGLPPRRVHRSTVAERHHHAREAAAFFSSRAPSRPVTTDEPTPPELLAQWRRDAALLRNAPLRVRALRAHIARRARAFRVEARMDSRARELRGMEPLDIEWEVVVRAISEYRRLQGTSQATRYPVPGRRAPDTTRSPTALPIARPGLGR